MASWKPPQEWIVRLFRRAGEKREVFTYTFSAKPTDAENRLEALDFAMKCANEWDSVTVEQQDKGRPRKPGPPSWWPKKRKSNREARKRNLSIPGIDYGKPRDKSDPR